MKNLDKLKILYKLIFNKRHPKIFSFHDCLPDVFSGYIELLICKRFQILGADELIERIDSGLSSGRLKSQKEVVLTFDDGRRNCWTVIYPLLKKYNVKALFFIIPSRIKDTAEYYPNLEDYWNGKVSWENLYSSHRKQPYLTWKELEVMRASGLVSVFSHSLKHEVVNLSSKVIDFQHPGVYEMPVYFDEWFASGELQVDSLWGAPIYERSWSVFAQDKYCPDKKADFFMNKFVKDNGDFLFFKKKKWRRILFETLQANKSYLKEGCFKKNDNKEGARFSIFDSKNIIENKLKNLCSFFSFPLYHTDDKTMELINEAGYKAVFGGLDCPVLKKNSVFFFNRIPGFWIRFLKI